MAVIPVRSINLKSFFDFDNADLVSNRKLQLSEKQVQRIKMMDASSNQFLLMGGCGALGGGGWALQQAISSSQFQFWFLSVVMLLLALVLLQGILFKVDNSVQCIKGVARVTPNKLAKLLRTSHGCTLWIDKQAFGVSPEILPMVQEEQQYALYYTKGSRMILSMEAVTN